LNQSDLVLQVLSRDLPNTEISAVIKFSPFRKVINDAIGEEIQM